ncbi:MAG TPA: hypothetical protein ENG95_03850 [Nitrospirae bacterium]|nr:hypothetical protein BMS3Abin10_01031 [bacterium BMS3Abin10]GBE38882.1 hypothetical protein BMS3Bbin08_01495 [bacterium BMS3Bbin08]HDH50337.1 hypothetical protein [Nitrospirota bacterium]HDK17384.1 hypothetical protein [Nitrospirota bacterium]HDO25763.1 hypothetical protein [Nitrospirota bacterium]
MKLGILVNSDRHADDIVGITKAAVSKGHEVSLFMMDTGVNLLGNASVTGLCKEKGASMSFCDHSAGKLEVSKDGIPSEVVCGSQFDNATMNAEVDKVIVL